MIIFYAPVSKRSVRVCVVNICKFRWRLPWQDWGKSKGRFSATSGTVQPRGPVISCTWNLIWLAFICFALCVFVSLFLSLIMLIWVVGCLSLRTRFTILTSVTWVRLTRKRKVRKSTWYYCSVWRVISCYIIVVFIFYVN